MRDVGIDISGQNFGYILTVCDNAKESCPIFPGKTITIHRNFEDPAVVQGSEEEQIAVFRQVRDELREYPGALTLRFPAN
jgi:arsenate reductase